MGDEQALCVVSLIRFHLPQDDPSLPVYQEWVPGDPDPEDDGPSEWAAQETWTGFLRPLREAPGHQVSTWGRSTKTPDGAFFATGMSLGLKANRPKNQSLFAPYLLPVNRRLKTLTKMFSAEYSVEILL